MTDYNELARIKRAAIHARTVGKPRDPGRCWAQVRQPSNGSAFGRIYGNFDNCRRDARRGCLTCHQHAGREDDAQALKRGGA